MEDSLRKSLAIYKGLVEVSGLIASITEYAELLRAILGVARKVLRAEAASLFLVNEEGGLVLTISSAADDEFEEPHLVVPPGRGIVGWVMEHGEAVLVPDAYEDPRFYRKADEETGFRTRSVLCAPLRRDGELIGVLQVLNPIGKAAFEGEDLDGFCAYANLTATAIEKLRALERLRRQQRVERDLAIASEIQNELLAGALPPCTPGACFAAFNRAAANVGGDFYDVFRRGNGDYFFAIGDVSGKGIAASLLMAQVVSAMEFIFRKAAGPGEALEALNEHLGHRIVRGMFVTALVGLLEPGTGRTRLAAAGHPAPWIVGMQKGVRVVMSPTLPLGLKEQVSYPEVELDLGGGQCLLGFTDGLTESANGSGEFFEERIGEVACAAMRDGLNPTGLLDALVAAEAEHRGEKAPRDDLTILVAKAG